MSETMSKIRQKLTRKISHKDPNPDFDADSGDEETSSYLNKEVDDAEKGPDSQGKPGSLLNRMISYGNKKTEDQIAADSAKSQQGSVTGTAAPSSRME